MRLRLQFITPMGSDSPRMELPSQPHNLHINLLCWAPLKPRKSNLAVHLISFMQIFLSLAHQLLLRGSVLIKTGIWWQVMIHVRIRLVWWPVVWINLCKEPQLSHDDGGQKDEQEYWLMIGNPEEMEKRRIHETQPATWRGKEMEWMSKTLCQY